MTKKSVINHVKSDGTNSNNINRGKPIYYTNELHYIVYEFESKIIISKENDLSKAFCVEKIHVSIKPIK
jgi:hypothetical protein